MNLSKYLPMIKMDTQWTSIYSIIHAFNHAQLDTLKSMKIVYLNVNNVVLVVNNAKDLKIFVLNVLIEIKIFLFLQEHVLISVLMDNFQIKVLVAALIVIKIVKYV